MTHMEKPQGLKRTIVMALLSLMAAAAPFKGQSAEVEPTPTNTVTATVSDNVSIRQQMFEKAVMKGAPKEEIAKYIDFPEFIPVTKDGQFDRDKAERWGKILAPYIETLIENGRTMSAADVYRAFKEKTGQKNVSPEDFETVKKIAERASSRNVTRKLLLFPTVPVLLCVSLMAGIALLGIAQEAIENKGNLKKMHKAMQSNGSGIVHWDIKSGLFGVVAMTALYIGASLFLANKTKSFWNSTPGRQVPAVYASMYNFYVEESIKEQEKQFEYRKDQQEKLEWQRVQESLRQKQ